LSIYELSERRTKEWNSGMDRGRYCKSQYWLRKS